MVTVPGTDAFTTRLRRLHGYRGKPRIYLSSESIGFGAF